MARLADRLEAFHSGMLERVDAATAALIQRAEEQLVATGAGREALRAGDPAPDFELPDPRGARVRLSERLQRGPAVLLFFRGGWCPYSCIGLRAWQDALPEIRRTGGQVLAISPQRVHACSETAERGMLDFTVLSDQGNRVADQYGVTYEVPEEMRPFYQRLGHDLPKVNGTGDWRVPLPASFIVSRDGRIALADVRPRIYRRLEPAEALEMLRELQPA